MKNNETEWREQIMHGLSKKKNFYDGLGKVLKLEFRLLLLWNISVWK